MENNFHVLVDSDAFVAWLMPDDAFHQIVSDRFAKLESEQKQLVTTSAVITETATVLSHRDGQVLARSFLEQLTASGLPVIHITEDLHRMALEVFKAQSGRGVSVVDCTNVATMRKFTISSILSFDKFYKRLHLPMLS